MSHLVVIYLGSLTLRSLCVAVLALLVAQCCRSVARRHAVWAVMLLIMLLMPAVDALLPPSLVPGPIERIGVPPVGEINLFQSNSVPEFSPTMPTAPYSAASQIDLWPLAVALYVFVTVTLVFRLGWGYRTLLKLKLASTPISTPVLMEPGAPHASVLYESDLVRVPLTGGFMRPFVVLPADWQTWDEWKLRAVLAHEFMHIRRAGIQQSRCWPPSIHACFGSTRSRGGSSVT